jgi:hypothetical protein
MTEAANTPACRTYRIGAADVCVSSVNRVGHYVAEWSAPNGTKYRTLVEAPSPVNCAAYLVLHQPAGAVEWTDPPARAAVIARYIAQEAASKAAREAR